MTVITTTSGTQHVVVETIDHIKTGLAAPGTGLLKLTINLSLETIVFNPDNIESIR
jgi:hypothetical protein